MTTINTNTGWTAQKLPEDSFEFSCLEISYNFFFNLSSIKSYEDFISSQGLLLIKIECIYGWNHLIISFGDFILNLEQCLLWGFMKSPMLEFRF